MATIPGPRPDRPLPTPGVPAVPERAYEEEEEQERHASPQRGEPAPDWTPEPYDPEREHIEPTAPVAVP
jgi:hypothetical protein